MENPVRKLLASVALAVSALASSAAFTAEKTIILAVENMYCAACPHTVKASLQAVPGVKAVKDKTAIVTYDDTSTDVTALTRATTEAGYPSAPRG
jgi:mercuric ion binding protein